MLYIYKVCMYMLYVADESMSRMSFRCKSPVGYRKCLKFGHVTDYSKRMLYAKFGESLFIRNNKTDNIK